MNKSSKPSRCTRRDFLRAAGLAATAAAAAGFPAPYIVPSRVFGADAPSNRVGIGSIGVGNMGGSNLKGFRGIPGAQIVAVCEVDQQRLAEARQAAGLSSEHAYGDYRQLLENKDVDAVCVSVPDHWHVPVSIAAIRAGKDVYCEKPLTLTIAEGRALADASRRYGRIVQTGSQQRSAGNFRFACELVRNGRIGRVVRVEVGIPSNNRQCEPTWRPEPVPAGFDYDFWLGPAPWAPYHSQRCHYQFRFILDYSGGQVTNWGAHHLDIAQWGLGTDHSGPVEIVGQGEFPRTGLFTTATRVHFQCRYAGGTELICRTGGRSGTRFIGTDGWVYVDRGKLETEPRSLQFSCIRPGEIHLYQSRDHKQNFLDCLRSRTETICPAEVGHRSATVCHLGNIAMLLKRPLRWDPRQERFVGDAEADRLLSRPRRAPWHA
ncbi:MAG: Gfo/Idh/MocA family oxidoreductase [Sedimentisphaerales bacterium]|nr:Gfo/Idh/MocA family oxidoreductase [Sedimentisphaerales bacterium]